MLLKLEEITYRDDGNPHPEEKSVEVAQISDEDFKERLKEIHETYQIIHDRKTGRTFEIAIVNKRQLQHGAILFASTMFSSLTQNLGNAIELAAHGTATPNTARAYIAFPGNGGSDSLSRRDRSYLARTGRFTRDGEAVESIINVHRISSELLRFLAFSRP
ncbi:MAG TPA: hypothetical protein VH540_13980 [Ktedonobacterales bacterium]|jgi:hypothetical protein